jgi:1-acyl-sn-glycerol-3-phosphate acyltransferase
VILVNREEREDRVKYQLSKFVIGPCLHLLARTELIGAENVPSSGAAILASNHVSILDSFYLPLLLERPVTFAAKSEYFTGKRPTDRVVGAYLRATKQLSVDRTGARAGQEMLQAALGLLDDGALFGIYPEGTRSPDGRLYRGRTGVGWLALHARVPVIPVAMFGTLRMLPPGQKVPRPGRVQVKIGKPLSFDEYADQPAGARQRRAVTDQVMEAIHELSGQEYVKMYASARKEQLAAERGAAGGAKAPGDGVVDRDPVV